MSSLVIPIGSWQKPPTCVLSCVIATRDGSRVVSGSVSGLIIIYKWLDDQRVQLTPEYVLVGHKSSIVLLRTVVLPVEDNTSSNETILLSASEDGEVAMWDLSDGRSLQNNPAAFPGIPTSVEIMGSSKHILVAGDHENISILDPSSLEVIKVITFSSLWCPALRVQPHSEPSQTQRTLVVSADGRLNLTLFDLNKLDFDINSSQSLSIPTHDTCIDMQLNDYDSNLTFVLTRKACMLYTIDPTLQLISRIDCPGEKTVWAGGQFTSKRTILLYTSDSQTFYFYLGPESSLNVLPISSPDRISEESVIVADHTKVIASSLAFPKSYSDYTFTCTAMFPSSSKPSLVCPVPSLNETPDCPQSLIIFEQGSAIQDIHLYVFHFWCHSLPPLIAPEEAHGLGPVNQPGMNAIIFNPISKTSLGSVWPSNQFSSLSITVATVVLKRYIAIGQSNGDILILPLVTPMLGKAVSSLRILKGHQTAVTALFVPEFKEEGLRKRMLSGSTDGLVNLWDTDTGALLESFSNHSMSVWTFVQVPSEVGTKLDTAVMSLSRDGSIAILDLTDCDTLHRFFGHRFDVRAVHWRTADSIMMVLCSDGSLYVRQMKTGHLDRVARGATVLDLLQGCNIRVDCNEQQYPNLFIKPKETISIYPISETFHELPLLLVYQVNIKKLINDVYQGVHTMTPAQHIATKATTSVRSKENPQSSEDGIPSSSRSKPIMAALKRAKMASWVLPQRTKSNYELLTPTNTNSLAPQMKSLSRSDYEEALPDLSLIQSVFSTILSWGLSEDMDNLCFNRLSLIKPASSVSIGIRGANGFLTFPVPQVTRTPKRDWCISSFFTANRQLSILSLSRSVLSTQGFEGEIIELLTFYSVILETKIGKEFCFPSLAFLAKYWQDPIVDVQQAARTLFESTIAHLNESERLKMISYWASILPQTGQKLTRSTMRAVIILGIIGSHSISASALDNETKKQVAEGLDMILRDEVKNAYRLLAVEIIGCGFLSWEAYINAPSMLRYLVGLTGLVATAPPSNPQMQKSSSLGASNVPSSSNHGMANFQKGAATALAGLGMSTFTPTTSKNTPSAAAQMTPGIMLMARQCLIQIATVNANLFISTLTFDLSHGRPSTESAGSLKLLGMFIAKKPVLLFPHLSSIVEAMVKILDPNTPHIRESLQQIVTVNFAELVKSYPSISFHAGSQKLAVGTMTGPVIVYDLRTATKIHLLVGHQKAVHAVSHSPDGKLIATYSMEENTVRIFQPQSGFLGTIMGALGGSTAGNATGHALATVSGAGQVKNFREFHVGSPVVSLPPLPTILEQVRFEWVGDREVKFFGCDQLVLVFRV